MARHYPDDDALARLAAGLLGHGLPKAEWTHAAHFGATLWLLRHRPGFDGGRDMPGIIRSYNLAVGGENTDTAGYHETITRASLAAAAAALAAAPGRPIHLVLDDLLAGPHGQPGWLAQYWSHDTLFSVAARRGWVEPDLAPLPW